MNNNRGVSLVELLVGVGMMTVISLMASQVFSNMAASTKGVVTNSSLEQTRNEIFTLLQDNATFVATINNPANATAFACVRDGTTNPDCTGAGGQFLMFQKGGTVQYPKVSYSTDTLGMTPDGRSCNTYGTQSCPFKYVAAWTAVCPPAQNIKGKAATETRCFNPLIQVTVSLSISAPNPQKLPAVNPARLRVQISQTQVGSSPTLLCQMMGLTYDPVTKSCPYSSPKINCLTVCGATEGVFVTAFTSDGAPVCNCAGALAPAYCNPPNVYDSVLVGINADGSPQCDVGLISKMKASGAFWNPPISYSPPWDGGGGGGC